MLFKTNIIKITFYSSVNFKNFGYVFMEHLITMQITS
jgi:hypothetical protein